MPDESTWVVLTGRPKMVRRKNRSHRDQFRGTALSISKVRFTDLLAHRNDDALVADHRPKPQGESNGIFNPGRNVIGEFIHVLAESGLRFFDDRIFQRTGLDGFFMAEETI